MPHAHRRPNPVGRAALPALLLALGGGAFAGLATQSASAAPQAQTSTQTSAAQATGRAGADLDRASRSRARTDTPSPVAPSPLPIEVLPAVPAPLLAVPVPAPVPVAAPVPPPAAVPPPAPKPAVSKAPASRAAVPAGARVCPVPAASFTDSFGDPRSGGRRHQGIDLMAPSGTPAYAIASGVVRTTSSGAGGISLYLRATDGTVYFYAHNSSNVARNGQRVQAGDLIAKVGSSGNASASGPHVHFEQAPGGGSAVNPYRMLRQLCG